MRTPWHIQIHTHSLFLVLLLSFSLSPPPLSLGVSPCLFVSSAMEWQQPSRLPVTVSICDGMATTVTAAHHFIWRHVYASIQVAQTPTSKLRFATPDKQSSMSTLWQEEEFKQICSRELLMEKAANIEKTIVVKEHERARYDFGPTMFYENLFGIGGQMA